MFSGRPNPRWKLDEDTSDQLRELRARLIVSSRVLVEPPGLGYRGFLYTDATDKYRAYKGYVATPRLVLDDPQFTLERFLLESLPSEHSSLRGKVERELIRPS